MEKAVLGATKPKCMYPKYKYLDTLLFGATTSMHNIMLIMNALQPRLSNQTWTISFKSLLIVHLLSRSDAGNDVLSFCASQRGILTAAYKGGANSGYSASIRSYATYLVEKVHVYGELQRDPVRSGISGRDGYLRTLSVSKGLMHHVACLQKQIGALLNCKFYVDELSNEITIGAFALLVQDLLRLFEVMNEGVINILQHFFDMTKEQARQGLKIYKTFAEQTSKTVEYFSVARRMENVIHINIPQLKHAPLSLVRTLEEYVNNPDFADDAKQSSSSKDTSSSQSTKSSSAKSSSGAGNGKTTQNDDPWVPKATSSNKKDLIDFFASIDNEETTIQQNPNTFQAQMLSGGNDFQAFQLQLQQQQFFHLQQMQQMQQIQQQNVMLQNQFTGMMGSQSFQPTLLTAQATGISINPFTLNGQQSSLYQSNIGSMDLLGVGGMNSIAPQSTGNPFRTGLSGIGSLSSPSLPLMTGPTHFNTMPNISAQATGAPNPFTPSSTNPLNPFSPNFGKVSTQPTGMMGMHNMNNNGLNNSGMGAMNNNYGSNNNFGMMHNQQTGNNGYPWNQQQQQQQQQQQ
ncbi:hypothetical protein BGX34_004219 [Mortierella sp. NVP85]|nr:hypothetical protein BGX34_004219 [Mortierella sp. NVP85]